MNSSDDLLSWLDIVVGITVAIGVMSMGWVEATAIGRIEATMALVSARISAVLRTGWTGVEYRWGCDDCVVIGRMLALRWGVSVVTTLSTYTRFVHRVEGIKLNNLSWNWEPIHKNWNAILSYRMIIQPKPVGSSEILRLSTWYIDSTTAESWDDRNVRLVVLIEINH